MPRPSRAGVTARGSTSGSVLAKLRTIVSAPRLQSVHLLGIALLAGGALAGFGLLKPSPAPIAALPPTPTPAPAPTPPGAPVDHATPNVATPQNLPPGHPNVGSGHAPGAPAAAPAGMQLVEGEVLEVLNVSGYTYARVGAKGTEGTWAAVPTAKLAVGDKARVRGEMMMKDFPSKQLGRTFATIWFGTLDDGSAPTAGASAVPGGDPHGGAAAPAPSVDVKVDRAPGGKTVAEILAERKALSGKTVRLRAVAVKVNANIMGKTYVHVRDGSGDPAKGNHDLTVTMQDVPKIGDTLVLEGVLGLDRDIGAGYQFPTILEDAKLVK
jgi:hypothetical protein